MTLEEIDQISFEPGMMQASLGGIDIHTLNLWEFDHLQSAFRQIVKSRDANASKPLADLGVSGFE